MKPRNVMLARHAYSQRRWIVRKGRLPMNDCFFCGPTENPLTEEHVWPQWVSRLLFGKYNSNHFVNIRSTGDNTTGLWKSRNIDVTTKTVCDKCNNVWLSSFETTEIKPI